MDLRSLDPPKGYLLRQPTPADTNAIVALINASKAEKMGGYATSTTVNAYRSLLDLPNFDAELDRAVVSRRDGTLAGYGHVINRQGYMNNNAEIHVHPTQRGQGIGTCLTQWAEQRARQLIPLAPEGWAVTLGCAVIYPDQAARNILTQQEFTLVRHFWSLRIELGDSVVPQWPQGITVRNKIRGQDEERIYQAIDETFRDHWGHVEVPFAEGFRRFMQRDVKNNPDYDPSLWFLALDGQEIAGYAICREQQSHLSKIGYVDKLGVRAPWRQRGIGLALLQHSFQAFAQRLYERAGMTIFLQKELYQKVLRTSDP
jgi:mycothiol synthase